MTFLCILLLILQFIIIFKDASLNSQLTFLFSWTFLIYELHILYDFLLKLVMSGMELKILSGWEEALDLYINYDFHLIHVMVCFWLYSLATNTKICLNWDARQTQHRMSFYFVFLSKNLFTNHYNNYFKCTIY